MNAISKRMMNLTAGRFLACMFTAFIVMLFIRLAALVFHMHIPAIVGASAYMTLFASRLWRVCKYPPPEPPFSHM